MNSLHIPASASSPEIEFSLAQRLLSIKGEAYPENAAAFWGEIIHVVQSFLDTDTSKEPIRLDIALTYFNSSSTKMLFSLFDAFNEKAASGVPVFLNWFHDAEDDTIYEFGQELSEDFAHLTFMDHALQG